MTNRYMPISLSMKGTTCLVVGGGTVAVRKIDALLDYDTDITVVSPECEPRVKYYAEKGKVKLEERAYRPPEAASYGLVISASDDPAVNQQVYDDTRNSGALVNVVDNPSKCDFIFPALVRRDILTVAISTDGKAPFLSGHLKNILESIFPDHWNKLARLAGKYRKQVQERYPDNANDRADCFAAFLNADWKTMLKEKNDNEIAAELAVMMENAPEGHLEKP
jgi:siroheme synthase-like protein